MGTDGEAINVIGLHQGMLSWWVEDLQVPELITCCEEAQRKATRAGLAILDAWLVAVAFHSLLAEKSPLTNGRSLKGYCNSNGLGKSGNPTSKTHKRPSSASYVTPTPLQIPLDLQTPPHISMGLRTMETACSHQQLGGLPKFLHQALYLRTTSSSPSENSWTTWRLQRPMTRLFLNSLSLSRRLSTRKSRRSCRS